MDLKASMCYGSPDLRDVQATGDAGPCIGSVRRGWESTQRGARTRDLPAEHGVVPPRGLCAIHKRLPGLLGDPANGLSDLPRPLCRCNPWG